MGPIRTAAQLTLTEITKRYDSRVVLDRVSFAVKPGERVGVIGENGSGKSTLLRLMAGEERPTNGELVAVAPGGVGYLPQTLALPPHTTVAEAVDLALADLREVEADMRAAERSLGESGSDLERYAELVAQYEARGGYEADLRVELALHELGLPGLDRSRPLGTLSGGERSRLALAATLASDPELLLLDEPTNDLDDRAVAWLEQRLRAHRGTVVAITHDRMFLERVTTAILEVADGQVRRYGDGYNGYLTAKAAERAAQARAHEEWKAELDRHAGLVTANAGRLAVIPRKTAKAGMGTGAWRARSRTHGAARRIRQSQRRLRHLTDHPATPPPEPLRFTATLTTTGALAGAAAGAWVKPGIGAQAGAAVEAEVRATARLAAGTAGAPAGTIAEAEVGAEVGVAAGTAAGVTADTEVAGLDGVVVAGRLCLDSLTLRAGERLLVTGPNGAGKTTLMRLLAGELRPDAGEVRRSGRAGFFRQDDLDAPDGRSDWTVLRAYGHGRTGSLDEHADALLALGLFRPADLTLRLGELSYGQRRRVELARLVSEPVDLLLLDEPTNHLSPMLVEQMEEALAAFPGALVVVTHDRRLRAGFTGSRLELAGGVAMAAGPDGCPHAAAIVSEATTPQAARVMA